MTKMKIRLLYLFMALALTFTFSLAQAAPGDPDDDPDPPPRQIPFDGGLSLIIAAGVAYAAKKGHDRKKKQQNSEIEK